MHYSVSDLAARAHTSVRTLHHYDEIGLLPAARTASGYRTYGDADLTRLARILRLRRLGFALDQVADLLRCEANTGETASKTPLGRARALALLRERRHQIDAERANLDRMQRALDHEITRLTAQEADMTDVTDAEIAEEFSGERPEWRDEAAARWGETDAYRESRRRVSTYTERDWHLIHAEQAAILDAFAGALADGAAPDSDLAMNLAERARVHINDTYYPCDRQFHAGLGEMYVSDERFTAYYDAKAEGLAQFVRDAIVANAARA
ncbi:MerR family transcriptional regulator [Micrococcales bacterium 31B]|nr:MerR family transcriptional regulator [Micrococcales bacterium 31B]